jgi:hypothetical protein
MKNLLSYAILLFILVFSVSVFTMSISTYKEGYIQNQYPNSVINPILKDSFPLINNQNNLSNNNYNDIWWHYPVLKTNSYAQITNNLKYVNNPDDGQCIRADFCGALYKEKKHKTNIITPMPPVPPGPGVRVNYYRSDL